MLKILLPPNLKAAAARDAVAIRVEWKPGDVPDGAALPVLAALQRLAPGPALPPFMQLTREQLRTVIEAAKGGPFLFHAGHPAASIEWDGSALAGVSEILEEQACAAAVPEAPPVPPPARPGKNPDSERAPDPPQVDGSEHFLAITLPSRGHHAHGELLDLLKTHGFTLETSNRRWWLRDRYKTLGFLAEHWTALKDRWGAVFSPNFERNTAKIGRAEVVAQARSDSDGFDVELELRAGTATASEVHSQVAAGRPFVESQGRLYLIERPTRDRLAGAQQALAGDPGRPLMHRSVHRVPRHRVAEVDALIEALSPNFKPPAEWSVNAAALRNHTKLAAPALPAGIAAILRDYQRLGVAWLCHLHAHGLGGVLADEMGLGKTLQALALLSTLGSGRSLVVCPASLVENWRREAARFVPDLRVQVHHGPDRGGPAGDFGNANIIVTSYGTLVRDCAAFEAIAFECLVADEAQHAKNRRTQAAAALRNVRARCRILLTGTPVENRLDDLRSLFEIALPGAILPVPVAARGEERQWHEGQLRRASAPFILRRTKARVAPELPPKIEQVIHCEAGPGQRDFYERVRAATEGEIERLALAGRPESQVRLAVLTQLLRLRQVCCDPRLLPTAEGEAHAEGVGSAKMSAFLELLDEAVDDGHRMLVFSQFTSLLHLVREELAARSIDHALLEGSMSARARQREVDRFQATAIPVFLISLKAGGTGLNLTGADTVVHFDPWWNPAVETQATDRAHRIGQDRTVNVYKLIVAGTVEEKVLALQADKTRLLADVFEESDAANVRLSIDELRGLAHD